MTQSEAPATKNYVIPTNGARLTDRHVYLGPYANTVDSAELAAHVAQSYRDEGIPCMVINSATPPEPRAVTELVAEALPEGLMCRVLTEPGTDCSNGGISSTCHDVVLLDPRIQGLTQTMKDRDLMPVRLWTPTPKWPAVRLRETRPGYIVADPAEQPANVIGPMASGAWIVSQDPRFVALTGSHRPIPLHDRFESRALYNALSSD